MIAGIGTRLVQMLPAEPAHRATIQALKLGLGGSADVQPDPVLSQRLLGLDFPNPVGLAAGFDKNAEVPDAMLNLGLGFVEVGSITPRPQAGNPKPRLFRLKQDKAVINRMGFNNEGHEAAARRLEARADKPGLVGVNIGANKDSEDRIADYVAGIERFKGLASFYTANISSPNTPGLRGLQDKGQLEQLLARMVDARGDDTTPILLKVAPDLDQEAIEDIAAVVLASSIDGLIVSNTTLARPDSLQSPAKGENGGLSGRPLFERSTEVLSAFARIMDGAMPLIGVGGICSGYDAYRKIRAGASLVELYSALAYEGPRLIQSIVSDLARHVRNDGFATITDAVGADWRS